MFLTFFLISVKECFLKKLIFDITVSEIIQAIYTYTQISSFVTKSDPSPPEIVKTPFLSRIMKHIYYSFVLILNKAHSKNGLFVHPVHSVQQRSRIAYFARTFGVECSHASLLGGVPVLR